ncbi:MAG: hypothetical protein K0Q55_1762 [Verrucomicrobia bacterium]|nr:hypothetical protein [Verrucomicrobiota bacterium]
MSRFSYILLLTALSAGPGMLWSQTEPAAGQDKENSPKEERRAAAPGENSRLSGEGGRSRGGREGRGPWNAMDDFRWLLAMTPEEREVELAGKSETSRTLLLAKLKEYDALSPEQQELRIRSTELFFDMTYLLGASPERRAEKLVRVPEDRRKLVQARLEQWDKLPPELQQEVKENQSALRYVIRVEAAPAAAREDVFAGMSAEHRKRVEEDIKKIQAMPKEKRGRMLENFHSMFDLSDKEQHAILEKLNQAERAKVEQRIADYEKLSPDERKRCMDSAKRFNNLSADDQARFIATAERWEKMSEDERNTWRNLVKQMPPLPPGLTPPPPLPPGVKPLNLPPSLPSAPGTAP